MKERTLLIDADVYAYQAAASEEVATDWGDNYWTWHVNLANVKERVLDMIHDAVRNLNATSYKLCLTDSERNWRLDVLPTYKGNRAAVKKPLALRAIREWLIEEHEALIRPRLEGDDIMGIFATWDKVPGQKIIVSLDKDMKTIPGLYCRDASSFAPEILHISPEQADQWHLRQTLSGDTTDGYSGCPGVGVDGAEKIISGGIKKVPYSHTLLRGPRKGEAETRFDDEPVKDLWEAVVSHYEAAGLTAQDALVQARVARILRSSDYNFQTKEPILWKPPVPSAG